MTSHLDRIRDKTGYRRRADLTRLALSKDLAYVSGTGPAGARAAGPPRKGVVQPLCGTRPAQADG